MEEGIEKEFYCIICYELPVPGENHARITACCGQVLCRGCFNQIRAMPHPRNTCPHCREKLRSHDNKFVQRVLHKLHDTNKERQRRHSAPVSSNRNEQDPNQRRSGESHCEPRQGPSQRTLRDCCQCESCSSNRCNRCTQVNRDGRTTYQGARGGFVSARHRRGSPSNGITNHTYLDDILAEIENPDEVADVALAMELSLQMSDERDRKCCLEAHCTACCCLSNYSDDYL